MVKRVRASGPGLLITLDSGDFLELKVNNTVEAVEMIVVLMLLVLSLLTSSLFLIVVVFLSFFDLPAQLAAEGNPPTAKRAADWAQVIKAFSEA